jgi:imidazolonepropionase-like amidohydrolase
MNRKTKCSPSLVILLAVFVVALVINNKSLAQMPNKVEAQQQTNNKTIAFLNVNVVPMDAERVLENQTVVVRDGRIAEIGAANKVKIPKDAVQIDGRGKFLMPGLADMHAHLQTGAGTLDDAAGQQLQLFLMNGVTTVRNIINRGELVAPTIFTAGAPMIVNRISTPEAAIKDVTEQKNAGYDLIKVHEGLSPEIYAAIVETANKVAIPFAGHVTATVGLERALKARQTSIEHLDGYIQFVIADDSPAKPTGSQVQIGEVLNYVDEKKIPLAIKATKDANVWNCPTLALFQIIVSPEKAEDLLKLPELKYVPQKARDAFAKQKQPTADIPAAEGEKYTQLRFRFVREMQKAGAKLLVGSDPGQLFLVAGFGTHKELESFVQAGLTPFQALEAATKNPAEYLATFMKIPNDFGVVKVGNKADLLLLEANPLQSIANIEKIAGVMTRGRWISKEEINKTLQSIAAKQESTAATK